MPAASALRTGPQRPSARRTSKFLNFGSRRPALGAPVLASSRKRVLLAVDVLDELVADLVRKNAAKVPSDFLDWVADEMTPRLENITLAYFADPGRRSTSTDRDTRDWVASVCLPLLERKIKGLDPLTGGHWRETSSVADTH